MVKVMAKETGEATGKGDEDEGRAPKEGGFGEGGGEWVLLEVKGA